MTVPYAELRDVYDLGLTAQSFVVRPRPLDPRAGDQLDFATGTFWMLGHGLDAADIVWMVLIASGGVGALPGGASSVTPYSPIVLDGRRFRLATSPGGTAVTFANAGSSAANGATSWGLLVDPERRLQRIILAESADVDQCLTAHATPLRRDADGRYPQKVVDIVARGAARRAIAGAMFENAASKIPTERLDATKKDDDAQKEAWRQGQPIYPNPVDQTDGQADDAMRAQNALARGSCRAPLHWQRGRL